MCICSLTRQEIEWFLTVSGYTENTRDLALKGILRSHFCYIAFHRNVPISLRHGRTVYPGIANILSCVLLETIKINIDDIDFEKHSAAHSVAAFR